MFSFAYFVDRIHGWVAAGGVSALRSALAAIVGASLCSACVSQLDDVVANSDSPISQPSSTPDGGGGPPQASPNCRNEQLDEGETAIDCGGEICAPCGIGLPCGSARDCASGACSTVCLAAECENGRLDGSETAMDCGGVCKPCADNLRCKVAADCSSKRCDGELCIAPSCDDEIQNGQEVGPDCGKASGCELCGAHVTCALDADCMSGFCEPGVNKCADPGCGDQRKNGSETGVDCGGSCNGCEAGQPCKSDDDCTSKSCDAEVGECRAPSCYDTIQNGMEVDADCGPGCEPCGVGASCQQATDCAAQVCRPSEATPGLVCYAATCEDGVSNGDETGIDCGGEACVSDGKTCELDAPCVVDADCSSNSCDGVCLAPTCDDGRVNQDESDADCGGELCGDCAAGRSCNSGEDCLGGRCATTCLPAGAGAACSSDTDCASNDCSDAAVCEQGGASAGCFEAVDCLSAACTGASDSAAGSCEPGYGGALCRADSDCASGHCDGGSCTAGEAGDACQGAADCFSTRCVNDVCAPLDMSISSNGAPGIDNKTIAVNVRMARGATPLTWDEFALLYFYSAEVSGDFQNNMNTPWLDTDVPANPTATLVDVAAGSSVFVWQPHSRASVPTAQRLINYMFHEKNYAVMNVANDYSYVAMETPNAKIVICRKVGGVWGLAQGTPPSSVPNPCRFVGSCEGALSCDTL